MAHKAFIIAALAAACSSCTVGPNYRQPPEAAPIAKARGTFVRAHDDAFVATPAMARWWDSLNDPILTSLVDDALKDSPSIESATARIRAAHATVQQQRAAQLPTASASAMYVYADLPGVSLGSSSSGQSNSSTTLQFYNLGLNASWEPDLFGGKRRATEQARASVGVRYAELADAQVSLSSQVASAYVNLRDFQERIRLNARATDLLRQALTLTQQRFAAGTASALDVERLQAQLETTDAQNLPLQAQALEQMNLLAVLIGREPGAVDALLGTEVAVPLPPATVAIGDPATLIAQRPDIRTAERTLAAGTAAIGVAKAKRLPSVSLTGILGLGGTQPEDMFDLSKLTKLAMPSLSWSLLDFGKGAGAVRQSEAERDDAAARYRNAVLDALQDAETALARYGFQRQQVGGLARAEAAAARAERLNRERVQAGTSSLIDQLDIQRQHLSAAIAVSQGKAALTNSFIAVQKSLGLGWTSEMPAQARARE